MTDEEFVLKYRPLLLHYLSDCWAMRREAPSTFGMLMDQQIQSLNVVLHQMIRDIRSVTPSVETPAPVGSVVRSNGVTRKVGPG